MDMRQYVVDKFSNILNLPREHTICVNLEKNVFNWAIKRTRANGEDPEWSNSRNTLKRKPIRRTHLIICTIRIIKVCLSAIGVKNIKQHIIKCRLGVQTNP